MLTVDLYLSGRIVRGRLAAPHLRPIDRLNGDGPQLALTGARAVAVCGGHVGTLSGGVLVPKDLILLAAVPRPPSPPYSDRWRPKCRRAAGIHLGPFAIEGTFHLAPEDNSSTPPSPADGPFIAVTEALVTTSAGPGGPVAYPLMLARRAAISRWEPLGAPPAAAVAPGSTTP